MTNPKKRLLVFVSDHHKGHEADFRSALGRALDKIPYSIFEDISKTPESVFSMMVGGILFSDAVLLDGALFTSKVSPDMLIQYGVCFALEKKCMFVSIKNNSRETFSEFKSKFIEGHVEFDYYLDLATQFNSKLLEWFDSPKPICRVKPNKLAVHSFITFGIDQRNNPDLYETVSNIRVEKEWMPRIVTNIGHISKLESLAKAVSQRSFCLFCLNKDNTEEIFLGIGLAIGMGRPFLIIKHKDIELPTSLHGYHGIIEYDNFSQLRGELNKYTEKFLSDEVFNWEGATYNDLLSRLERQIGNISPTKLDEFEAVLLTVNSALGDITAKPFALLGEIYREKNRKISPDNIELLVKAKEYYEKALNIQKNYQLYQNAVTAIDKHIQLTELINEKKYRSIPSLINLIGGDIKSDHYIQVKEYLLGVVKKLVEEKNFVHSISLLAAMQIHDKSEEIQKLIHQVLESAPLETIKALQDSQKYVVELENEKTQLISQIKEKDAQLDKIAKELTVSKEQLETSKSQLAGINENLERVQKERDVLSSRLKNISAQLDVDQRTMNEFETKIESAKTIGRQVVVNFGHPYGWAIYRAIDSEPYVVRAGERLSAKKGLVLEWGDKIYDEDGIQILELLSHDAVVFNPDDDYYADVRNLKKNID